MYAEGLLEGRIVQKVIHTIAASRTSSEQDLTKLVSLGGPNPEGGGGGYRSDLVQMAVLDVTDVIEEDKGGA